MERKTQSNRLKARGRYYYITGKLQGSVSDYPSTAEVISLVSSLLTIKGIHQVWQLRTPERTQQTGGRTVFDTWNNLPSWLPRI